MYPEFAAVRFYARRHAMISFAAPEQVSTIAEVAQSFTLDNGAFSAWRAGEPVTDWSAYYDFVGEWALHPGFDWALIPDVIDGDEAANDALIEEWPFIERLGVPVWHLHESIDRLIALATSPMWPRIALGSSGEYSTVGDRKWWWRMAQSMDAICHEDGAPNTKLHGLRMLDPNVFSRIPLSSADSTNVARNAGLDVRWTGPYVPRSPEVRAFVLADRIESHASAARWSRSDAAEPNMGLFG